MRTAFMDLLLVDQANTSNMFGLQSSTHHRVRREHRRSEPASSRSAAFFPAGRGISPRWIRKGDPSLRLKDGSTQDDPNENGAGEVSKENHRANLRAHR